ncbi:nucleoporin Nup186/Nup192/Nup205 [Syncephalis fuscata]|nr:nucleoporin Nup186/Nup192/Nup205 [Syncephalis fuscata]
MSAFTDPQQWRPDSYRSLQEAILAAVTNYTLDQPAIGDEAVQETARHLASRLEAALPDLKNLLDDPPRDPQHRAQVEKGTVAVSGNNRLTVNQTFIKEALLLAEELNIDEYLACSLLHHGKQQSARFDRSPVETAIFLYHAERNWKLSCLTLLFKYASDIGIVPKIRIVLSNCVATLIGNDKGKSIASSSFPSKALKAVDQLKQQVEKLNKTTATDSAKTDIGADVRAHSITSLTDQRHALGPILFSISYIYQLDPNDMTSLLETLRKADTIDEMTAVLLVVLLASIDSLPEHEYISTSAAISASFSTSTRNTSSTNVSGLQTDRTFLMRFNDAVAAPGWQVAEIGAVVTLQWGMFLMTAVQHSPALERELAYREDRVEQMMDAAVTEGAFSFLESYLLAARHHVDSTRKWQIIAGATTVAQLDEEFQTCIQTQVDTLVTSFLIKMHGLLKKIRSREEHQVEAYTQRMKHGRAAGTPPRNDVGAFFDLIATLYADRPDAGLKYWQTDRLRGFLSWGRESNNFESIRSYLRMLGSLTGKVSSQYVMEFVTTSTPRSNPIYTWTHLFDVIGIYIERMKQQAQAAIAAGAKFDMRFGMKPSEVTIMVPFLHMLRQVVFYSPLARMAIYEHPEYQAIERLFNLATCFVPIEVKAALFNAIAAFCLPDTPAGADISRRVWAVMEASQVLRTVTDRDLRLSDNILQSGQLAQSVGFGVTSVFGLAPSGNTLQYEGRGGIQYELEELETARETYPETRAFLNLLNTLIHTPSKRAAYRLCYGTPSPSVPDDLGAGMRQRTGIVPYINFVIEHVFLKAASRGYANPAERWTVTEAALALLERCLISFDLANLCTNTNGEPVPPDTTGAQVNMVHAIALMSQPGFAILTRLLCGSQLLEEIVRVINISVDTLNRQNAQRQPAMRRSVQIALRLLWRVTGVQDVFIDKLVPAIVEHLSQNAELGGDNFNQILPPSISKLDQWLLYRQDVVIQIALYITCHEDTEICWLAVRLLLVLSQSSAFSSSGHHGDRLGMNRLVGLLESSVELKRILHGFIEKLEFVPILPSSASSTALSPGMANTNGVATAFFTEEPNAWEVMEFTAEAKQEEPDAINAVRLAILELLLKNLETTTTIPTLAHLLLGFQVRGKISETRLKHPNEDGGEMSLFHSILDLLRHGTEDNPTDPLLIQTDPKLAVDCYQLIYRLCRSTLTSVPTLRYLHNDEDYFNRQCLHITADMPITDNDHDAIIVNGVPQPANFTRLYAQLHQRAWLMKTLAIQLHTISRNGIGSQAKRLMQLLFQEDSSLTWLSQSKFEMPKMRILALLDGIDFAWRDSLMSGATGEFQPTLFAGLNFERCASLDTQGAQVYDLSRVFELLLLAQRHLEQQGRLVGDGAWSSAQEEKRELLRRLLAENHYRQLEQAKFACLLAWQQLVEVALRDASEYVATNTRASLWSSLAIAVLPKLTAPDRLSGHLEGLGSVLVAVLSTLKRDQRLQQLVQYDRQVPVERLSAILKGLVEAVQMTGTTLVTRGNLYAALLVFLHYCGAEKSTTGTNSSGSDTSSLIDFSQSIQGKSVYRSSVDTVILNVLQSAGDRFLETICRDAVEADDVWRTVAYTLLEVQSGLWRKQKTDRVLAYLSRWNVLQHCVDCLRQDDPMLQSIIASDSTSGNLLYVYEARMAFFLRLSQRREGALKLLEAGIVETLTECRFLDRRPDFTLPAFGEDLGMATTNERYYALLLPALQLMVSLMTRLRDSHYTLQKMMSFVTGHKDSLLAILKEGTQHVTMPTITAATWVAAVLAQLAQKPEPMFALEGYSSFRVWMLGLLSKYCAPDRWAAQLTPLLDIERFEHKNTPSSLDVSVFQKRVEGQVTTLCEHLVLFCRSISSPKNGDFVPLFHWTLTGVMEGDTFGMQEMTTPSLGVLAIFLRSSTNALTRVMDDHQDLLKKKSVIGSLRSDELSSILSPEAARLTEEITSEQKHRLVEQELERVLALKGQLATSTLYVVENVLALLYRHISYYLSGYAASLKNAPLTGTQSILTQSLANYGAMEGVTMQQPNMANLPNSLELDKLRTDANVILSSLFSRLKQIELPKETIGAAAEDRQAFIVFLAGRLQDLCFLGGDDTMGF